MAAASAALKLGSLVREVAICSTKKRWNSGVLEGLATSELELGFVRSRVMVAPDDPSEGGGALVTPDGTFTLHLFGPDVAPGREGCGWLCSPS